ncbi:putative toxin-antitoxin system toxin component, PIN family [Natronobeatus ordinarius]|uniref:putative toxin-antitoxin system toxin component, PIN family n=1 Tax=Natronobeatus ordinarius TaxID=2963433 RepID=UPI0020CE61D4|nr:putative toxin-antitoxin system toxin component, PIN family [Natronobeatus ordinarius]
MKAVLDTNVLISSVISKGTPHNVVVAGFEGEYQIVVSVATLTEFRETLLKYPDRFHMDEEDVQKEVETIRYFAEFVEPEKDIRAVEEDPDDDKFLEAAVAGNVDYLVSGDQHLLDFGSFRGIEIVTPRVFYDYLHNQ